MKNSLPVLLILCFASLLQVNAQTVNVKIIRSKGFHSWAQQDSVWNLAAKALGYQAVIDTEAVLNTNAFYTSTDVLVISEAEMQFTNIQWENIYGFVKGGKSAYIQAEYLSSYMGSKMFKAFMDSAGVNFQWLPSVSGTFTQVLILPPFSSTPNLTTELDYFNYGLPGTGSGVDSFLIYSGQNFGFYFNSGAKGFGKIICVSDEDWIWRNDNLLLNENILYQLAGGVSGTRSLTKSNHISLFPNPSSGQVSIVSAEAMDDIKVLNPLGQLCYNSQPKEKQVSFALSEPGIYFLTITSGNTVETKKVIIAK